MADALVNSGVMFAVQLALIWFGAKEEYGAYSLLMSYVVMGQAILSAVFGAPLITSVSPLPVAEREAALAQAVRWHGIGTLALALAGGPLLYLAMPNVSPLAVLLTLGALVGLALRDIQRVVWAIEGKLDRAVVSSLAFGVLTAAILLVLHLRVGAMSSASGMAAVGTAAILTAAGPLVRRAKRQALSAASIAAGPATHARWTLPGVLVIWIQNNLYLTILAVLMTLSAVAEVSAARMVAMPYMIAAGGLLRLNQVRFGRQLVAQGPAAAFSSAKRLMMFHLAIGATLAGLLWAALELGTQPLVSAKYPNLIALASLWFLFAGASSARGALSALYQAEGAYRTILLANLTTVPTALIGMMLLIPLWGTAGAIAPLIAAELQFLLVLLWLLRRR